MARTLLISLLILSTVTLSAVSQAQTTQPATPVPQSASSGELDDGKVYKESEVDIKAQSSIADLKLKDFDEAAASCPSTKQRVIRLRLVLSRLRKVTDVKVLKEEPKCGLAEALIKDVRTMVFVPAMKDGRAVSVYRELQIKTPAKKK